MFSLGAFLVFQKSIVHGRKFLQYSEITKKNASFFLCAKEDLNYADVIFKRRNIFIAIQLSLQ